MGTVNNKSWTPRRPALVDMSRNFWMPDESCSVCYECDSQFTIFNRKHHCRLCGRVFCARCTADSVPAPALSDEPRSGREHWDRVRVCNYCFKQREQGLATASSVMISSSPLLSPSSSVTSLVSAQSSCHSCNSNNSAGSAACSTGSFQHVPCSAGQSSDHSAQRDSNPVKQDLVTGHGNLEKVDSRDIFSVQFGSPSSGRMVACFQYAPIDVLSVHLPPSKLEFNYDKQEWVQKELDEVRSSADLLFSKVLEILHRMSGKNSNESSTEATELGQQILELEVLLQKEKEEFEESLQHMLCKEVKVGQPAIDILEINRLRRQLVSHSYVWDRQLIHVSRSDVQGSKLKQKFVNSKEKPTEIDVASTLRELVLQGGVRLVRPMASDDTVVPIFDDEPTSIISYALVSPHYQKFMSEELGNQKNSVDSSTSLSFLDSVNSMSLQSFSEAASESLRSLASSDESILSSFGSRSFSSLDPLSFTNTFHTRVSFSDEGPQGKVKYSVTCYFAKQFEALRRTCCPTELDFIRSLSRCKKWGAQGGKSNVFFAKTLDDRFIIKQVSKTELESFFKFAPYYFKYLNESINTGCPTCLAKILGIYQVTSKHLKGGKESRMDVLVMENLLFKRNIKRLYDLKGSSRSRYNPDSSGSNKVLLDQNLIETMPTSPIFLGTKAKRLLERAVWNDTSFLASMDVMDYSLLVGVDEEKHELVLGIIDFMRQYTWDKHLETWVKAFGGPKNAPPTVISPMQYKKRFRKAMSAYFLMVPEQWSSSVIIPGEAQADQRVEENSQETSTE